LKKFLHECHRKGGLGVEFTVYTGAMMPGEHWLTSFTLGLLDAYRNLASRAQ